MRSNQGKIAVTCAPSGADSFTQAVVSNRVQLCPAPNFAVGPERPQGSSCRPNASSHAKHSLAKRAQSKNMLILPLRCTLPVLTQTAPLVGPRYSALAGLFRESNAFAADASNDSTGATEIDLEEQAAGYQVAYSKLATAGTPSRDVVAYAGDVRVHVAREFTRLLGAEPGMKTLVGMAEGSFFVSLGVSTV